VTRRNLLVIRTLTIALGCMGVAWGLATFPVFRAQAPLQEVASRIVQGQSFRVEALQELVAPMESAETGGFCRPAALRAIATIRLRIFEEVFAAAQRTAIDASLGAARHAAMKSLACTPADPFTWLMLFWLENTAAGFQSAHLAYLQMSYRLGPNEGWIALKRNPLALAVFEQLPPDLADMAIREFARLVETGLYAEAAAILTGPGWRLRDRLLGRLDGIAHHHRRAFAKMLHDQGYEIAIPGVKMPRL
jgi:hypothetical protein